MIRCLTILTLLTLSASAVAADPPPNEVKEITFENDNIKGELLRPNMALVQPGVVLSGPDPLLVKAEAFFEAGDMVSAISRYEVVVTLDGPEADYAHYKLGWCQLNLSKPEAALEQFTALSQRLHARPAGRRRDAFLEVVNDDIVRATSLLEDVARMKAVAAAVCASGPSPEMCVNGFNQAVSRQLTEAGRGADARRLSP